MNTPPRIRLLYTSPELLTHLGKYATERDYSMLITESTIVEDADTGAVVAVYIASIVENTIVLLDKLRHMDIPLTDRMSGAVTQWEIFGNRPRNGVRNPNCAPAALTTKQPDADRVLRQFGRVVTRYYRAYGSTVFDRNTEKVSLVRPEWRIAETPFTSGIVNKDGLLPYHYDKSNFPHMWSAMLGFKQDVIGGYLCLPNYEVGFEIADRSLLLFDGQSLLHGVTPMQVGPGGWRYTVVWYSRAGMVKCQRPDREAQRRH